MAFIVTSGSLIVVVPTASEAIKTYDRYVREGARSAPTIATFDGLSLEIEEMRKLLKGANSSKR